MTQARYQIFISSTFADLELERQRLSEVLLRTGNIPAGMELFTASGLPPWDVIEAALRDTDYFVLVLAGRYGTLRPNDKISYTEAEYDYARANQIPVLAFLFHDLEQLPVSKSDSKKGSTAKQRDAFHKRVREGGQTIETWTSIEDLVTKVGTAITAAIRTQPRPGWHRGPREPQKEADQPDRTSTHVLNSASEFVRGAIESQRGDIRIEQALIDASEDLRVATLTSLGDEHDTAGHEARSLAVRTAAKPLFSLVAAAARWGSHTPSIDAKIVEIIGDLSTRHADSGLTDLLNLSRAPGLIAFTAAGIGACAGRRDDLVGLLLSDAVRVENPYQDGRGAAVAALASHHLFGSQAEWPSRRLYEYVLETLSDDSSWPPNLIHRSWERWSFLLAAMKEWYRKNSRTRVESDRPYLMVEERDDVMYTVIGDDIATEFMRKLKNNPIFTKGNMCDGDELGFTEAAFKFDKAYGHWGNEQDWAALPSSGSGGLPTGPHYPRQRQ